jgi:DNA-directed RNA polymerase specialized sigma subunit
MSEVGKSLLNSPAQVIRCLVTYPDWWQPLTSSFYKVVSIKRRGAANQGFREGLVESLDERTELCRRMHLLDKSDRFLLYLWYVRQAPVNEVSKESGLSRRQCFRRRASAIRTLAEAAEPS